MKRFPGAEFCGRSLRGAAALVALAFCLGCGPVGPFSGGRLSGEDGGWPENWNRVSEVMQIQLETLPDDPHSVNLWFVVVDQDAFLATSLLMGTEVPEERAWVQNVRADPRVRIRIDGIVYPARIETFTDSSLRSRVFEAFRSKYSDLKEARGAAARFFRVVRPAEA